MPCREGQLCDERLLDLLYTQGLLMGQGRLGLLHFIQCKYYARSLLLVSDDADGQFDGPKASPFVL